MPPFTAIKELEQNSIVLNVEVLANGKTYPVRAVVDTGATYTSISKRLAEKAELKPVLLSDANTAAGRQEGVKVYRAGLVIEHRMKAAERFMPEFITGSNDEDVLIEMDILGKGEFAFTHYNDKYVFTFRYPPTSEPIDFRDSHENEKIE